MNRLARAAALFAKIATLGSTAVALVLAVNWGAVELLEAWGFPAYYGPLCLGVVWALGFLGQFAWERSAPP